jgi:integrase
MRSQQPITLGELVEEWISVSSEGGLLEPNTVRAYSRVGHWFVKYIGPDRQVRGLTVRDLNAAMAHRRNLGLSANTLNQDVSNLRRLFLFASEMYPRDVKKDTGLLGRRRGYKVREVRRTRIPPNEFPALLDATAHPRDRAVLAIGLYLLLRQGEISTLRIMDLSLTRGEIETTQHKTGGANNMPVCSELDSEMRRWLTYYTEQCGPLQPRWFLVPSKSRPSGGPSGFHAEDAKLQPTRQALPLHRTVQHAMVKIGYPVKDEQGKSLHEGGHTLRRSAARAIFDRLVDEGYDGALRTVQSMLHHKSSQMTERYIGIELDEKRSMDMFSGKAMFPVNLAGVTDLDKAREARAERNGE